ncbi:MAG: NAD(P)/FAD-dependent oxidoreductase [Actinobacteria bacterium]|jgi:NADPH-dependent 2,4-dienoyl-CoA reductase/sulfur reductase-like enzyme|nr:NAD(P)/FAD-dependent oxidoreductase [Actinomycetota bacterium]
MNSTTVIVGASLAGINAARTLRLQGHAGSIIVVDADSERPYDRPPLSKQMLTGEWEPEKILLPAGKEDLDLEFRLGVRAKAVDLGARQITLEGADGTVANTAFDSLVIASGASARRLPDSAGIAGVHVVRTLADSLALRAELEAGPSRVVVIGAGFIGAEVASSCRKRGIEVTLVEAMPLPLERILGAEMGRVCAQVHIENGVDLRLGTGVLQLETETVDGVEKVVGVALTDGTTVATEIVVVGIGVTLNVDWLEGSGLTLDDGVVCDNTLLAAPGVVAAGDIARYPSARFGRMLRVEHWETAIAGGEAAARRLLAEARGETPVVFDPIPWFWSDQYDRKIQLAGRPMPTDTCVVVHGSTDEFRFVALYGDGDRLTGVLGMNRPRHVVQLRALFEEGASFSEACERAATL